jgi:hypothetical protein
VGPARTDPSRRATHEDYTIAILESTDLGATIDREFPYHRAAHREPPCATT